jgi:hypothetical protein
MRCYGRCRQVRELPGWTLQTKNSLTDRLQAELISLYRRTGGRSCLAINARQLCTPTPHPTLHINPYAGIGAGDTASIDVEVTKDWPETGVPQDLATALGTAPQEIQDLWNETTPGSACSVSGMAVPFAGGQPVAGQAVTATLMT